MKSSLLTLYFFFSVVTLFSQSNQIPIPIIDGDWWRVSSDPDLGEYQSDKQQPVDFGIWQAADGRWQLWSCIRNSNFPGSDFTTRFLYGWEGQKLTDADWKRICLPSKFTSYER